MSDPPSLLSQEDRLLILDLQRLLHCMSQNDGAGAVAGTPSGAGAEYDVSWQSLLLRAQLAQELLASVARLQVVLEDSQLYDRLASQVDQCCRRAREVVAFRRKQLQQDIIDNNNSPTSLSSDFDLVERIFFRREPTAQDNDSDQEEDEEDDYDVDDFSDNGDSEHNNERDPTAQHQQHGTHQQPTPSSSTSVEELQQAQREQMEEAISQMASQMKTASQDIHIKIKHQAGELLDEMETVAGQNVDDVKLLTKNVSQHVSQGWKKAIGTWTLLFTLVGIFCFCLMTIYTIPKRKDACLKWITCPRAQRAPISNTHDIDQDNDLEVHDDAQWQELLQENEAERREKNRLAELLLEMQQNVHDKKASNQYSSKQQNHRIPHHNELKEEDDTDNPWGMKPHKPDDNKMDGDDDTDNPWGMKPHKPDDSKMDGDNDKDNPWGMKPHQPDGNKMDGDDDTDNPWGMKPHKPGDDEMVPLEPTDQQTTEDGQERFAERSHDDDADADDGDVPREPEDDDEMAPLEPTDQQTMETGRERFTETSHDDEDDDEDDNEGDDEDDDEDDDGDVREPRKPDDDEMVPLEPIDQQIVEDGQERFTETSHDDDGHDDDTEEDDEEEDDEKEDDDEEDDDDGDVREPHKPDDDETVPLEPIDRQTMEDGQERFTETSHDDNDDDDDDGNVREPREPDDDEMVPPEPIDRQAPEDQWDSAADQFVEAYEGHGTMHNQEQQENQFMDSLLRSLEKAKNHQETCELDMNGVCILPGSTTQPETNVPMYGEDAWEKGGSAPVTDRIDPNAADGGHAGPKTRFSPHDLRKASANGHADMVVVYLANLPSPEYIDRRDRNGWTALHLAARSGHHAHTKIIAALLSAGADFTIKSKDGQVALDCALERLGKDHESTKLLKEAMGDRVYSDSQYEHVDDEVDYDSYVESGRSRLDALLGLEDEDLDEIEQVNGDEDRGDEVY
jgi:hypothetical protein